MQSFFVCLETALVLNYRRTNVHIQRLHLANKDPLSQKVFTLEDKYMRVQDLASEM